MDKLLYAAETTLYLCFMGMDVLGSGNTAPLKFAAILLLSLSVLDFREAPVSLAFLFTLAADVFLLLLNRWYAAGIACFLIVQILYATRLKEAGGFSALGPSLALSTAAGLLASRLLGFGLTEALAASYITLFSCNLARAFARATRSRERKWILFASGMALFFCCDLCVGLHNMPQVGEETLRRFVSLAMWGFYLPGQVLIRASAYGKE